MVGSNERRTSKVFVMKEKGNSGHLVESLFSSKLIMTLGIKRSNAYHRTLALSFFEKMFGCLMKISDGRRCEYICDVPFLRHKTSAFWNF